MRQVPQFQRIYLLSTNNSVFNIQYSVFTEFNIQWLHDTSSPTRAILSFLCPLAANHDEAYYHFRLAAAPALALSLLVISLG